MKGDFGHTKMAERRMGYPYLLVFKRKLVFKKKINNDIEMLYRLEKLLFY
jgi:hypothetical protein